MIITLWETLHDIPLPENNPFRRVLYSVGLSCLLIGIACLTNSSIASEKDAKTVGIVFAGDVMVDGNPGHAIQCGRDPFAEFGPIFHEADLAVCNLECVVGSGGSKYSSRSLFAGPASQSRC